MMENTKRRAFLNGKAWMGAVAMAALTMAASAEVAYSTVESGMGYSSWPMIQAVGDRIVCVYSRGTAHSIVQGVRDAFVGKRRR